MVPVTQYQDPPACGRAICTDGLTVAERIVARSARDISVPSHFCRQAGSLFPFRPGPEDATSLAQMELTRGLPDMLRSTVFRLEQMARSTKCAEGQALNVAIEHMCAMINREHLLELNCAERTSAEGDLCQRGAAFRRLALSLRVSGFRLKSLLSLI